MAKLTKRDINKIYFRNSFTLQLGQSYEKMQGLEYTYMIMPASKRLHGDDPDKMKKALKTHPTYFNTTPAMSHLIINADMILEEEVGIESEEVVMNIKTGLIEPFTEMGDTLLIAIYHVIVFSIAAYTALEGSLAGPPVSLVACAGVLWVRYRFTTVSYSSGRKSATGFTDRIVFIAEAASILGLTMIGALIPSVIKYNTGLQFTSNKVTFALQEMLDKILPYMLSLGIVMLSYWLLGKRKIDSAKLIFTLTGLGVILGSLQDMLTFVIGLF